MSLRPCVECRKQISSEADKCPACGAPQPQGLSRWKLFLILIFGAPILYSIFGEQRTHTASSALPVAQQLPIDASAAMQVEREKLIQDLTDQGVFERLALEGTTPDVYVSKRFQNLDFELKQKFVSVVYAYSAARNQAFTVVLLKDARTNKKIGSYTASEGLKLD